MPDTGERGTAEYWVELVQRGRRLGAGFLLTRTLVLTAGHCLKGIAHDDDQVVVHCAGGQVAEGRLYDRAAEADLALILLTAPLERSVPLAFTAGRSRPGQKWRGPYRPALSDPYLSGDVTHGSVQYECVSGSKIEALQLATTQRLGDYSGYSGGPVETDAEPSSVLGVLLEQYPDRQTAGRSSDVLFAATLAEVMSRFDYVGAGHLLDAMHAPRSRPQDAPGSQRVANAVNSANTLLTALHEWGRQGILDIAEVEALKVRVARSAVEAGIEAIGDD